MIGTLSRLRWKFRILILKFWNYKHWHVLFWNKLESLVGSSMESCKSDKFKITRFFSKRFMARKVENWRRIAKLTFWIFTRFKSAFSTYRYLSLPICDSYHWYSYHLLPFLSLSVYSSALLINRFYQIIINRSNHTLRFFPFGFIRSCFCPLQENYLHSPALVYPSTTSQLILSRPSSPVNRLMGGISREWFYLKLLHRKKVPCQ